MKLHGGCTERPLSEIQCSPQHLEFADIFFKSEACVFNEVDREMLGKPSRRVLSAKKESVELLPFNTWCSAEGKLQLSIGLSSGNSGHSGPAFKNQREKLPRAGSLLNIIFLHINSCICTSLCSSLCVSHVYSTIRGQNRASSSLDEDLYVVVIPHYRSWEPNPGLPKELKYI